MSEDGSVPPGSAADLESGGGADAYVAYVRVRFHELDPLGHVNNASYLVFLEQAAIDHAATLGFDHERLRALGGVFIARRHEIDYIRPARAGDLLRVLTWVTELRGARAVRHYEIGRIAAALTTAACDGPVRLAEGVNDGAETIVRARTEWAFVDAETGRPRRIPPEVAAAFPLAAVATR